MIIEKDQHINKQRNRQLNRQIDWVKVNVDVDVEQNEFELIDK